MRWCVMQLCLTPKIQKYIKKCINEVSDLTLEKTVNFARTFELSRTQLKCMGAEEDKTVNFVSNGGKSKKSTGSPNSVNPGNKQPATITSSSGQNKKGKKKYQRTHFACRNCGNKHEPRKCPAFGKQCNYCTSPQCV